MSNVVIHAEGLGKRYRIDAQQERYKTFQDTVVRTITMPARVTRRLLRRDPLRAAKPDFWALKDVSFDIREGDVVGIIGRNGAGKSTLLKILSRITEPTEGSAIIHGRVGALLEVGTGFHPELSGRENIYLNGSILGMSRHEIERKLDEIIDFAGTEKFIDTPVKRYSSGMSLRLGFAVAAHLEPDVLIVDEVLAVGDMEFQKKCLGKMQEVAGQGRTVLFVSHNLAAVKNLCTRGFVLNSGSIVFDGSVGQALQMYQGMLEAPPDTNSNKRFQVSNIRINNELNQPVDFAQPVEVECWLQTQVHLHAYRLACAIEDAERQLIVNIRVDQDRTTEFSAPGRYRLRFKLPPLWLVPGVYSLYFKFLPVTEGVEKTYFSEQVPLDVVSSADVSNFRALLYPRYELDVEAMSHVSLELQDDEVR